MDIASPWDHRVYEKEGEKIEKYQDLKREIARLWGIRHLQVIPVVVDALGVVSNRLDAWLEKLGVTIRMAAGEEMTQSTVPLAIGYGSLLWCNVGITSARAKALHLHNNNNNNNNNNSSRSSQFIESILH